MELIVASAFSALIILLSVFSIIKVLLIGFHRKELSRRRLLFFSAATILTGMVIASILPLVYSKILQYIY